MTTLPVTLRLVLALCAQGQLVDMAQALVDSKDVRLDPLRLLLRDVLRALTRLGVLRREEIETAQIDMPSLESFFLGLKGLRPQEFREIYTLDELAAVWRAEEVRLSKAADMTTLAEMIKKEPEEAGCAPQADATARM